MSDWRVDLLALILQLGKGKKKLVPGAGVEPARALSPGDFESPASASSATPAPAGRMKL